MAGALIWQRVEDRKGISRKGHQWRHVPLITQHRFIRYHSAPAIRRG
jgi:hypothetical protein